MQVSNTAVSRPEKQDLRHSTFMHLETGRKKLRWVAKKTIDEDMVKKLLQPASELNHFTNGSPCVKQLEDVLSQLLKVDTDRKRVIAVVNGAAALHAVASAMDMFHIGGSGNDTLAPTQDIDSIVYTENYNTKTAVASERNGNVTCTAKRMGRTLRWATQSYTFPASAQGSLKGALIVDIDSGFGPDFSLLNQKKDEFDALVVTNVLGHVVDITKYEEWCETNGKFLVFDDAATSHTIYNGVNCLNYGKASIVSLHHTKPIGFGEGGCIVIDKEYESCVRKVINFGYDTVNRKEMQWDERGSNYKMSDLSAAYILQYLGGSEAKTFHRIREHHAMLYQRFLHLVPRDLVDVMPTYSSIPTTLVSCFPVFRKKKDSIVSMDDLAKFEALEIEAKKYYKPLELSGLAYEMYQRNVCLPCNLDITLEDVEFMVEAIKVIFADDLINNKQQQVSISSLDSDPILL